MAKRRPRAKTKTTAKGGTTVRKRQKQVKKYAAKALRKTPRAGEMTAERLLVELGELGEAVYALQTALSSLPDSQVIVEGSTITTLPTWCEKGGPLLAQPQLTECWRGLPVTAVVYKRFLANMGLMIEYLIEQTK